MGLGDIANKGKDALNGDKGEQISDQGLDRAADAAGKRAGEQHQDKVQQARDQADKRIGNE